MSDLIRRLPRFGMSFFRRPPSTYAPQDNVPVTQDYRIGVGDEITLTLWGIPEEGNFRVIVNRDGMATIPHIGAVRLAGYTLQEAERIIAARLNQYYTGYQMNLSMGRLRSILVYVTGNAQRPGAYTVSSFATLVNALLASGGPSANGSLRKIELKRNGTPEFWTAYNGRKYTTLPYMYTWPIPESEIRINPAVRQNPGYTELISN